MGGRSRGLSLTRAKNEPRARGSNFPSDLRLAFEISAWFGKTAKLRDAAATGFLEIETDRRASSRASGFSALCGLRIPEQGVGDFLFAGLEGSRLVPPRYAP